MNTGGGRANGVTRGHQQGKAHECPPPHTYLSLLNSLQHENAAVQRRLDGTLVGKQRGATLNLTPLLCAGEKKEKGREGGQTRVISPDNACVIALRRKANHPTQPTRANLDVGLGGIAREGEILHLASGQLAELERQMPAARARRTKQEHVLCREWEDGAQRR